MRCLVSNLGNTKFTPAVVPEGKLQDATRAGLILRSFWGRIPTGDCPEERQNFLVRRLLGQTHRRVVALIHDRIDPLGLHGIFGTKKQRRIGRMRILIPAG